MVPIIGFLPQTVELSILAIKAAGFSPSNDSNTSVELLAEEKSMFIVKCFYHLSASFDID